MCSISVPKIRNYWCIVESNECFISWIVAEEPDWEDFPEQDTGYLVEDKSFQ